MSGKLKILLLEDNPNDVVLIQHELKKSGLHFSSETVQTQEEFEQALIHFIPDLILADYTLPDFDGAAAYYIKQKMLPQVPFIFISSTIGEENAVELIKNGVTDYVLKDKLFTLNSKITRALKEVEAISLRKNHEEKLELQNEKLLEIANLQSHQVRVPVVHILGLFNLFNFDDPTDPVNAEVLGKLKTIAELLDDIITEVVKKTSEIEKLQ